jgi:DNA-directed RNA polymerase specialized sigma24 family protein
MHVPCTTLLGAFVPPLGTARRSKPGSARGSAAFRTLVFNYADRVHSVLSALLGSRTLATEASVAAFARAYCRVEESPQPLPELIKLALAECSRLRWRRAIRRIFKVFEIPSRGSREATLRILRQLCWHDRVLLVLREVGGLSPEQVAYVLSRGEADVRADLFIARQHLLQLAKGIINENRK